MISSWQPGHALYTSSGTGLLARAELMRVDAEGPILRRNGRQQKERISPIWTGRESEERILACICKLSLKHGSKNLLYPQLDNFPLKNNSSAGRRPNQGP